MALLHYHNLEAHQPDKLMKKCFNSLKLFYDFLNCTQKYLQSDAAVKRLAWEKCEMSEQDINDQNSDVWIQLVEPEDRPNEPESTFNAFMDENVREIFCSSSDSSEQGQSNNWKFHNQRKLLVLDREPATYQLLLDQCPTDNQLLLRPDTYTLSRQIRALRMLQDSPSRYHRPLLRLIDDHAHWPCFELVSVDEKDWMVLTDDSRSGTEEQREFVKTAISTPDFALLEGPPGSGKTTAICELVLQLVKEGKRVLLCASTHVAVDNVLERLMDERNTYKDFVIPVRIGDRQRVSESAAPWQLNRFVKKERERLLSHLNACQSITKSQQELKELIRNGPSAIERMILDAANLVCGTTVGILQHPDIKAKNSPNAMFDVLIVDEASKTTFQEFLVPALYAKRWIIVGDPKQLSPFVDDAAMAANVEACLSDETARNACIDVFMASKRDSNRRRVAVAAVTPAGAGIYSKQAEKYNVEFKDADKDGDLWKGLIVVGAPDNLESRLDQLPLDVSTVRASEDRLVIAKRRASAWANISGRSREAQPEWASEVAWRLVSAYDLRLADEGKMTDSGRRSKRQHLAAEVESLLPVVNTKKTQIEIDRVRRVALPSILESLQCGFERDSMVRHGTALTDGLPEAVLGIRHVTLKTQHRMHPDIAAFSHEYIYNAQALFTPDRMKADRQWGYARFDHRAVWHDTRGGFNRKTNSNSLEAREVIKELQEFDGWARDNPRNDSYPWEVAVLTFYRGQEREIRNHLRKWNQQRNAIRHFFRGPKNRPYVIVELCTVDRFQGHEADLVLISIANSRPTSFLQSPNRLNVVLTRARFQRVVFGDRHAMMKDEDSKLGIFASNEKWEQSTRISKVEEKR